MTSASDLARVACGAFLLVGLGTGIWKYRAMITSAEGVAPVYVDICHRASLMYAFACLVLVEFARLSVWPDHVNLLAVVTVVLFFALATGSYAVHGVVRDTENQLQRPHRLGRRTVHGSFVSLFVTALAIGEIGGFLVLFTGYLEHLRGLS